MRRIGLYSLIAIASLALVGLAVAGLGTLGQAEDETAERANAPTTTEAPAPETTSETSEQTREQSREQSRELSGWRDEASEQSASEREAAEERAAEREPENVQPAAPASAALSLTVPKIGMQNDPVTNSVAESVLARGAGKLPSTGFPWQEGSNTYIAAHVYGYPGTGSWQQFADLPSMTQGDAIFLTDSNGTVYEYRVTEILRVDPTDVWVTQPTGESTVSLQTCVGPGWSERLIVRGTMVGTSQA